MERFYDPNAGRALVEKIDVKEWNLRYLRENMSIVSQEPSLFIGTIAENISYGKPGATQEQIEEAARMANIHDFIQSLPDQYKTEISNSQLSGGQKQRVGMYYYCFIFSLVNLFCSYCSCALVETSNLVAR